MPRRKDFYQSHICARTTNLPTAAVSTSLKSGALFIHQHMLIVTNKLLFCVFGFRFLDFFPIFTEPGWLLRSPAPVFPVCKTHHNQRITFDLLSQLFWQHAVCISITLPLHFLLDLHYIFSLHFAYASFSL